MGMLSATRTRRSDPPGPLPGPPTRGHAPRGEWANGATPTPPRREGCSTVARGDVGTAQGGWGRSAVHRSAPFGWPAPAPRGRGEETQTLTEDCYRSSNGKRKRPKPNVGKSISNIGFQGFCRTPKIEVRSLLQSLRHIVVAGGSAVCGCLAALAAAPPRRYVAVESARRPRRSSRPSAWRERRPVRGVRAAERPAPVGAYTSWKVCGWPEEPGRAAPRRRGRRGPSLSGGSRKRSEGSCGPWAAGTRPRPKPWPWPGRSRPIEPPVALSSARKHPNQARRTPAADHPPGRPRRIRLAQGTSEVKYKFRDRSSGR